MALLVRGSCGFLVNKTTDFLGRFLFRQIAVYKSFISLNLLMAERTEAAAVVE